MEIKIEDTYRIAIHMAGDFATAKSLCKKFAWDSPTCVTVKPQTFIYTGGLEEGVEIGLVNYPRFPKTEDQLVGIAKRLTEMLIEEMHETSALIVTDQQTFWLSRRNEVVDIDPTKT
ncbi:MAG: hypothetical protein DRQ35_01725 [Gammaproteobacteria bacterium]|nr:MAG: hypothetical protein DRQ35_01725 [Gammaproteobacteria bacterium]